MLKQGSFSNPAMATTFVVLLCLLPVAQLATNKSLDYGLAGLAGFGIIFEPSNESIVYC